MAKQVISVDGEDVVVREDTAKAFRGVHWALISLAAFILIAAILFLSGVLHLSTSGTKQSPSEIPQDTRR